MTKIDLSRARCLQLNLFRRKISLLASHDCVSPRTTQHPTMDEAKVLMKIAVQHISGLPKYPDPTAPIDSSVFLDVHSWVAEAVIALAWVVIPTGDTLTVLGINYAWACNLRVISNGYDEGMAVLDAFDPDWREQAKADARGLEMAMQQITERLVQSNAAPELIEASMYAAEKVKSHEWNDHFD